MPKLYKIKTTASPNIGFPFPELGIYINQELYDELSDSGNQRMILNQDSQALTDNFFRRALKDVEGYFKHRNIYYNYFSEENQQFSTGNNKRLWDCLRQIGNVKIIRNMSTTQCNLLYNGNNYGDMYCFTEQAGAGGSGYRVNSQIRCGAIDNSSNPSFGGYYAPCDYSSGNLGYTGAGVKGFRMHVFPESIINEDTGEIQNDGTAKAVVLQIYCQDFTQVTGMYRYVIWYLGTVLVSQITNASMFYGTIPEEVNTDPYAGGGSTDSGGGQGSFDRSSDPIDVPALPLLSAIDTGFVSLWRPSTTELLNLYNYMWSSAFDLESFKKIFANPIDAIMGFGIIPLNPVIGTARALKIGNINTGVNVTPITAQYYQVDCGTLYLDNFFDTYLEFEPYSTLEIFLPFCGCMQLSADDFYRRKKEYPGGGKINVKYNVDILSGSCVAFISCYDINGATTMTYEFNGNLLTQIPITGNDFTGLYNAVLGIAGNVVSGVAHAATGNAAGILGDVVNAAHNVTSAKPSINRSGTIGGSYGLLANRKPFLIRNIPREAVAWAQNLYKGYPSHVTKGIGSLSDYTEFEVVYLHNVPASDPELKEIEDLLKTGVIL